MGPEVIADVARRRLSPRAAAVGRILTIAFAIRVIGALVGFAANVAFPDERASAVTVLDHGDPFWDSFARYDSGWYVAIARHGYRYVAGQPNDFAYFPVYPLLMRAGGTLLGGGRPQYYEAGIAVSWAAFLLAMVVMYRLASLDLDEASAERAVVFAAVFPFAFFFGRVYTESVFLLAAVSSVYCARTNRWAAAAVIGALAAATRPTGVLIALPLVWLAWRAGGATRTSLVRAAAVGLTVAAGVAAFSAYAYVRTGSPLEWAASIERWNYHPGGTPWSPLVALTRQLVRRPHDFLLEPNGLYDTLNGLTALVFLLAVPVVWVRLGAAYGLFMLGNLLVPLSSGQFEGLGRYCAVLFPFFIWMGTWRAPAWQQVVLIGSVSAYALCLSLFVNLHPIF